MRTIQTERLILREFSHDDAQFVLKLHQNPDLVRFIPSVALHDLAGAHAFIDRRLAEAQPQRGWWCVTVHDAMPVAAVVLKAIPPSAGVVRDDVEVGWRQHAEHTGHGYVTEAARAVVAQGFAGGLSRIVAVVKPLNLRSQRVCRRLGMRSLGRSGDYYDDELELYELLHPPRPPEVRRRLI